MEGEYSCDEEDDNITSVSQIVRDNNDGDLERSRQVARSVLSSLFNITVEQAEKETGLIKTADVNVENIELEFPVSRDEDNIEDVSSQASCFTEKLEDLSRSQDNFTARITDWINTVTLLSDREAVELDTSSNTSKQTDSENQIGKSSHEDEDEDDQPSAMITQVEVSPESKDDDEESDDINYEALDELKRKYKAERISCMSSSIIPNTAFQSFKEGFSQVQLSNGSELFDNGTVRNRRFIDDLPRFSHWNKNSPRNYHLSESETTEHKMRVNIDGTCFYDRTHKKERSERVYDEEVKKGSVWFRVLNIILSLIVFCVIVVFINEYFQLGFQNYLHTNLKTNTERIESMFPM